MAEFPYTREEVLRAVSNVHMHISMQNRELITVPRKDLECLVAACVKWMGEHKYDSPEAAY